MRENFYCIIFISFIHFKEIRDFWIKIIFFFNPNQGNKLPIENQNNHISGTESRIDLNQGCTFKFLVVSKKILNVDFEGNPEGTFLTRIPALQGPFRVHLGVQEGPGRWG